MSPKKNQTSSKHRQIDKANTLIIVSIAAAAALLVFSLIATKTLWTEVAFKRKVISQKEVAVNQLKSNINSLTELNTAYQEFVQRPTNIINGSSTGTGDKDGDNAKIVLDSLPSKYDFPALVSSLEKMFPSNEYNLSAISGIDDELAQQGTQANSGLVEVPFSITVEGSYVGIQDVIGKLERSIRPMKVEQINLSGSDAQTSASITLKTYYLPEKTINVQMKEVQR